MPVTEKGYAALITPARDLLDTWRDVRDNPAVTKEPTDGRPVRSILHIWRRCPDGLWRSEGRADADGVPFTVLAVKKPLRELNGP